MKIVIVQGAFLPVPPKLGGAVEKRWFAMGKAMAEKGHEVIHISRQFENMPEQETIEGVVHKRVKGYKAPASGIILKLLDLLYSGRVKKNIPEDADAIVTNTFWLPLLLSAKQKKKCMVDVARMPKGQMKLYRNVARLRGNSTPVINAIKADLSAEVQGQVVLIPNPLPFRDFSEINFTDKKKVILYAGRVHPEKGVDILINAFRQLSTDWTLKIVGAWQTSSGGGGEAYRQSLQQLATGLPVEFLEPIYDIAELNRLYKECSVFVYPSVAEKGETFGLAPLEAMSWGCVPVVSSLDCFKDFIRDQENGFIFDHRQEERVSALAQLLKMVIDKEELRNSAAHNALAVRKTHSTDLISDAFIREFEKMNREYRN